MSVPPRPPDRPTEPLRPTPARTVVDERVMAPAPAVVDPNVVLARLEDAVNSLRTGLMIVGVLAVAALGVAIYALLSDDERGAIRGGAASQERVARLDDRVDRLSRQVQSVRGGDGAVSAVDDRVDALERSVEQLADRPAPDATPAIDELSERIDDLAGDVEELRRAQQATP